MRIKFIALIFLTLSSLFARDIIVEDTHLLYAEEGTPGLFPTYTQDGKSVLFTSAAYKGLWVMDRAASEIKQVTDVLGAGFHPRSLSDGSIIFRRDEYVKGRKYTSLYKSDASGVHLVSEGTRFVSPANMINDQLIFLSDETPVVLEGLSERNVPLASEHTSVLNDKLTLKILQNGSITTLSPLGDGNYIWAEISPTYDKLVFTLAGRGTYICDLDGKILTELGYAHTAHWSPNGEFLVYMVDEDDGVRYTASEIWVVTADGSQAWMITETSDRIEMYPQWSPDGSHIVYHTLRGEIFETAIQIVD